MSLLFVQGQCVFVWLWYSAVAEKTPKSLCFSSHCICELLWLNCASLISCMHKLLLSFQLFTGKTKVKLNNISSGPRCYVHWDTGLQKLPVCNIKQYKKSGTQRVQTILDSAIRHLNNKTDDNANNMSHAAYVATTLACAHKVTQMSLSIVLK